MTALGVWFLASPEWFFGPSWSYFSQLPHNGFGIGTVCVALGVLQTVCIRRDKVRWTANLLWLGGFVNWTAGILLGAEGLLGHQGLQEAPLFCTIGGYKFIVSSMLTSHYQHCDAS
jgi:hypothetical protein